MSGGPSCKCGEHTVPLTYPAGSVAAGVPGNLPAVARLWRVVQRNGNASAFNGYHWTASDYSCVTCLRCGRVWRTKAAYVMALADIKDAERNLSSGHTGHRDFMASCGREVHPHHGAD